MAGELFEVEQLLEQRLRGKTIEYLVRWKGYEEDEDSWEPEENLRNCQAEIAKFKLTVSPPKSPAQTKTPTRSRSKSRTRAVSKSPARTKKSPGRPKRSPSPSKKTPSPSKKRRSTSRTRTRSRSRSRSRATVPVTAVRKSEVISSEAVQKSRSPSRGSSRVTKTVTTTTRTTSTAGSSSSSAASIVAASAARVAALRGAGDAVDSPSPRQRANVTQRSYVTETAQLKSVVVPRSLQQQKPESTDGQTDLSLLVCRDFLVILVVTLLIVTAAAHYYGFIDVTQLVEVVRSNLPSVPGEAETTTTTTTAPPTTTTPPPTTTTSAPPPPPK